jgi:hypothetical protein
MAKSENSEGTPATNATTATPRRVRGLLDVMEAEANGQAWVLDGTDALAGIGLGLGASQEAKELALLGLFYRCMADIDKQLANIKPKRGAPEKRVTIDMQRAAAVLGADDLLRDKFGKYAGTQKDAILFAMQLDQALCKFEKDRKSLFSNMTSMERIQTSVSKGLKELGQAGKRFSKK